VRQILKKRSSQAGITGIIWEPVTPHGTRAGFLTTAYKHGVPNEENRGANPPSESDDNARLRATRQARHQKPGLQSRALASDVDDIAPGSRCILWICSETGMTQTQLTTWRVQPLVVLSARSLRIHQALIPANVQAAAACASSNVPDVSAAVTPPRQQVAPAGDCR
jgi:hypothetical protein